MRRNLIIIICLLIVNRGYGQPQSILIGKITELNSGRRPVTTVQVIPSSGTAVYSNTDGSFILLFDKRKAGDRIILQLIYKDWLVINEKELVTIIPEYPKLDTLKLYMCSKKQLLAMKLQYYNTSVASIEAKYKVELVKLDKQNIDYARKYNRLMNEKLQLMNEVEKLAERYTRINMDEISDIERLAMNHFLAGDINEAIKTLETVNSAERLKQAKKELQMGSTAAEVQRERIKAADKILLGEVKKLIFQGDLYKLAFQWEKAQAVYEAAAKIDSSSYESAVTLAEHLELSNDYSRAKEWYDIALSLASTRHDSATLYRQTGEIHSHTANIPEAIEAYNNALALLKQTSSTDALEKAFVYNGLGICFSIKADFNASKAAFARAIELFNSTPLDSTQTKYYANTYNNLGGMYLSLAEWDSAKKYLSRALDIYNISDALPSIKEYIAGVHSNLGQLYRSLGKLQQSETELVVAVEIFEQLIKNGKSVDERNRAMITANLGLLYQQMDRLSEAEIILIKAVAIYKELAGDQPELYHPEAGKAYDGLAYLYSLTERANEAKTYYERSLDIYTAFAKVHPEKYKPILVITYERQALFFDHIGDYSKSEKYYLLSLNLGRELAMNNFPQYQPLVGKAYLGLASHYFNRSDWENAKKNYAQAVAVFNHPILSQSTESRKSLAFIYSALGSLFEKSIEYKKAEVNFKKSINHMRSLVSENLLQSYRLAETLTSLGKLYMVLDNLLEAESFLQEAKNIYLTYKQEGFAEEINYLDTKLNVVQRRLEKR